MLSPVSTGMGDRVRVRLRRRHFISVCNQPPKSTQPSTLRGMVKWVPAKGQWCSAAGEYRQAWCDPCLSTLDVVTTMRYTNQRILYFTVYLLNVTVTKSSSDNNAPHYILPVLWMTPWFHACWVDRIALTNNSLCAQVAGCEVRYLGLPCLTGFFPGAVPGAP